eukprot:TRINITY_DN1754_c0_g1_i2.p1 TRINITY_DN1754_c0_g1~~TRINITY_DN1754_c0_g1_i2.p1  ORF type:complete len:152 (+),score=20.77 TRINITY_DN1754_c0_g1_i2:80-535(+)
MENTFTLEGQEKESSMSSTSSTQGNRFHNLFLLVLLVSLTVTLLLSLLSHLPHHELTPTSFIARYSSHELTRKERMNRFLLALERIEEDEARQQDITSFQLQLRRSSRQQLESQTVPFSRADYQIREKWLQTWKEEHAEFLQPFWDHDKTI